MLSTRMRTADGGPKFQFLGKGNDRTDSWRDPSYDDITLTNDSILGVTNRMIICFGTTRDHLDGGIDQRRVNAADVDANGILLRAELYPGASQLQLDCWAYSVVPALPSSIGFKHNSGSSNTDYHIWEVRTSDPTQSITASTSIDNSGYNPSALSITVPSGGLGFVAGIGYHEDSPDGTIGTLTLTGTTFEETQSSEHEGAGAGGDDNWVITTGIFTETANIDLTVSETDWLGAGLYGFAIAPH